MQQEVATAILDRTADLCIVYANTASRRPLSPNESIAYDSAMSLLQQICTGFEIAIDQQIIAPSCEEVRGADDEVGEDDPGRDT